MVSRHIPVAIQRELLTESGYRCAVPTCRSPDPLDFEHIEGWAEKQEHKFEDMIVLCASCHARKTRGKISKPSLRKYKSILAQLNGRYTTFEARLLEQAAQELSNKWATSWFVTMDKLMLVNCWGIIKDGYFHVEEPPPMMVITDDQGRQMAPVPVILHLTGKGFDWCRAWLDEERAE